MNQASCTGVNTYFRPRVFKYQWALEPPGRLIDTQTVRPKFFYPVSLRWGLRICMSVKFPDDDAGLGWVGGTFRWFSSTKWHMIILISNCITASWMLSNCFHLDFTCRELSTTKLYVRLWLPIPEHLVSDYTKCYPYTTRLLTTTPLDDLQSHLHSKDEKTEAAK